MNAPFHKAYEIPNFSQKKRPQSILAALILAIKQCFKQTMEYR
jgi:hypothetical protein